MTNSVCRLTRVVTEDATLEVAQIEAVMSTIELALRDIPQAHRAYIANALLNAAVSSLVDEEGEIRAAGLLMRLGDAHCERGSNGASWRAVDLSMRAC
jgi:hypothetical protein